MFVKCVLAAGIVAVLSSASGSSGSNPSGGDPAGDEVQALRARGAAALEELFARRDALIGRRAAASAELHQDLDRELAALDSLIDQVGGQKYCTVSRLFWYTELDKAQAASRESRKPILTLRMMGKLTDEYSCANSRFFRSTLYANRTISKLMRDRFVLHWASVRPVPKVTIDYGDGRKLHRTLTGNSIHYVLDTQGRVIDGLPGLHSPQRFQEWLTRTIEMAEAMGNVTWPETVRASIAYFHTQRLDGLAQQWESDLQQLRAPVPPPVAAAGPNPPAEAAMQRAAAKSGPERPLLPAITMRLSRLADQREAVAWDRMGAVHAASVQFDEDTIAFIKQLNPVAGRSGDVASAFDRLLKQLERSVAVDSVRNEYDFHRQIHQWLAEAPETGFDALNERVYSELFLTPRSDPWIGLRPEDAFAALADDGVEAPRRFP